RAIVLVFRGRAEIVESLDISIHSVSRHFPIPSVVRLDFYVRLPSKPLALSKRNVLRRDGHQCQYCGSRRGPFSIDHVLPRAHGGKDTWENLVCSCHGCNNKKGDRSPGEAGLVLNRKPRTPHHVAFIRHYVGVPDQRWRPYLFMDDQ
ncbi:MAG: HNH endonuclease, partial [bacterium]|nr:HNH endonuclease [bacterium]